MSRTDSQLEQAAGGLDRLDPLLQHRPRLGAMVLLGGHDAISFVRLRELLKETDGNLGAQLRKLEDAGYIHTKKMFDGRKPITWYSISGAGLSALKKHLLAVESLIKNAGMRRDAAD